MGVYIKGMEMPDCCNDCALLYDCFACMPLGKKIDWETSHEKRLPDCPLVHVPVPHGRLVDASEDATYDARYDHFDDHHMIVAQHMLDDLPTVLEGELTHGSVHKGHEDAGKLRRM